MKLTPELSAALDGLYRVFERYPLNASTNPCLCCHSPDDEIRLRSKPLRELSAVDLSKYAFDALHVWGSEDDFKHFLPRLFGLLVTIDEPSFNYLDPEALIGKLAYASWGTWPTEEHAAIQNFLDTMWRAALNTPPDDLRWPSITGWLTAVAGVEDDLSNYLNQWLMEESPQARHNLARLILELGLPYNPQLPIAYWEGRREQWSQLREWSASPAVRRQLESGIKLWPDSPFAEKLLEAAAFLPSP